MKKLLIWNSVGLVVVLVVMSLLTGCRLSSDPKSSGAPGSQSGFLCVRVFSEADYHFTQVIAHSWPRGDEHNDLDDSRDLRSGTAYALYDNNKWRLITAAHVVARSPEESEAFLGHFYTGGILIKATAIRVRVSSLSFSPERVVVDTEHDVAVMEMPAEFWQAVPMRPLYRSTDIPGLRGSHLFAWGFPGTSTPQFKETAASDIEGNMLVLNLPLEPGYSGGPVVTADGTLVGMILNATDQQTRCLRIGEIESLDKLGP